MGGWGSGRRQGGRNTTSDYHALDVRRFQREGLLVAGHLFGWRWMCYDKVVDSILVQVESDRVIFTYRYQRGEDWKDWHYPVLLTSTPCHYGGARAWFICPTQGCGRRVAKLYLAGVFACRHCYRLVYACQRENLDDRVTRQADKIRERLKWQPGILNWHGRKPKGMHWRTFKRLTAAHDAFVGISLNWMQQCVEKIGSDVDKYLYQSLLSR